MLACNYHSVLEIETRASDMGSECSTIKLVSYFWFLLTYFPQGSWCYLLRGLWWLVEWEMEENGPERHNTSFPLKILLGSAHILLLPLGYFIVYSFVCHLTIDCTIQSMQQISFSKIHFYDQKWRIEDLDVVAHSTNTSSQGAKIGESKIPGH